MVTKLQPLRIATPTEKSEQTAIATALSDVDALITQLEKLITKKRQIKQGAMQTLLNPFDENGSLKAGWEKKTLGDIATIKTGSRNNEDKVDNGIYPFFVRSKNTEKINSYSYDCEAILVPGEGQIESTFHYIKGRFDVHQRVYAITQFSETISARYVYLFMTQYFGLWAKQNTVKATVDSLRLPTFQNFKIFLPIKKTWQDDIESIIFVINSEITTLETKLAKTKKLKQGMMQQLLTGKIRLVDVPYKRD